MATIRSRTIGANQVVLDQADFFEPDGITRVVGLALSALVSQLFFNNSPQAWPLVSGVAVPDSQVVSGYVYFSEIPTQLGFYSVRFRPNALGYWRNLLTYTEGLQLFVQDFDVVPSASSLEGGLQASFIRPPGSGCC